jgi:hypothetical protein
MPGSGGITEDLIRIRLFFISYVPLWVMLAFRATPPGSWHWDGRTSAVVLFALLAVWGFVDAIRLIKGSRKIGSRRLVFGEISDQGGNAAGYLATYLLPFIGLVPADWGDSPMECTLLSRESSSSAQISRLSIRPSTS